MQVTTVSESQIFSPEKMKKVNLFDTPRMFCDLYCFNPGQAQKPHAHANEDKLYYVIEGRGTFRVGTEEREIPEKGVVLAPAGMEHAVWNNSDQPLVLLVMMAPKPSAQR